MIRAVGLIEKLIKNNNKKKIKKKSLKVCQPKTCASQEGLKVNRDKTSPCDAAQNSKKAKKAGRTVKQPRKNVPGTQN